MAFICIYIAIFYYLLHKIFVDIYIEDKGKDTR